MRTQRWYCAECDANGDKDSAAERHTKTTQHTTHSGVFPPGWPDVPVAPEQRR